VKNNHFIVAILLLFCIVSCKSTSTKDSGVSQKSTLIFKAMQEDVSVNIYKPIDDTYNSSHISDKLNIKLGKSINYDLVVNNYAFILCEFSKGKRRVLLVEPGDRIEISCDPQKITISGNNAEGNNFLNEISIGDYINLIKQHITKVPIDYDDIYYCFQQEMILPYKDALKKMEASGSITSSFSTSLAKNFYFGCYGALLLIYSQVLIYNQPDYLIKNFKLSDEDVQNMLQQMDDLYNSSSAMNNDIQKMANNVLLDVYYAMKYKYMDGAAKKRLIAGYDEDLGYSYLLLAPDSLQLKYYGQALLNSLQDKDPGLNYEKRLAYLSSRFPDSEYVAIMKKKIQQLSAIKK